VVGRRPSASRLASGAGMESAPKVIAPKLNTDPIWSLRCWPLQVTLGVKVIDIPALSAVEWLTYLMQPQLDIDGMILDLLPDGEDMLFNGNIDLEELYDVMLDIIATVCARPWWVALRQVAVARDNWHVLGPLMLEAMDAQSSSIAGWLDVLMAKTLSSMDPKDVTMFTSRLEAPPIELQERMGPPIEEMEMDRRSFLSMQ
jgi:hypothetical protein